MNRARKIVVSTGAPDLGAWANCERLDGDLVDGVARLAAEFTVPSVVGDAEAMRLFDAPAEWELVSVDAAGPGTLTVLVVPASG